MTNSELVEQVAREILGWKELVHINHDRLTVIRCDTDDFGKEVFDPFHDINDIYTILKKFKLWKTGHNELGFYVGIETDDEEYHYLSGDNLNRIALEVILKTKVY